MAKMAEDADKDANLASELEGLKNVIADSASKIRNAINNPKLNDIKFQVVPPNAKAIRDDTDKFRRYMNKYTESKDRRNTLHTGIFDPLLFWMSKVEDLIRHVHPSADDLFLADMCFIRVRDLFTAAFFNGGEIPDFRSVDSPFSIDKTAPYQRQRDTLVDASKPAVPLQLSWTKRKLSAPQKTGRQSYSAATAGPSRAVAPAEQNPPQQTPPSTQPLFQPSHTYEQLLLPLPPQSQGQPIPI
jgi:hypothetical protein